MDGLRRLAEAERPTASVVTPPGAALVPTARAHPIAESRGSLVERMVDWVTLKALRTVLRVMRWLIAFRGRA